MRISLPAAADPSSVGSALREAIRTTLEPPVLVPTFNNPTYTARMVAQLAAWKVPEIVVLDNASTFRPMIRLLRRLARKGITVVDLGANRGPRYVLSEPEVLAGLPEVFMFTDPDIAFHPAMPPRFWETLHSVSEHARVGKVGLALDISDPSVLRTEKFDISDAQYTIVEWETQFWADREPLPNGVEGYLAPVDTTFALCNQRYFSPDDFYTAVRLAGEYTARHLPWYTRTRIPRGELEFYKRTQTASYYSLAGARR